MVYQTLLGNFYVKQSKRMRELYAGGRPSAEALRINSWGARLFSLGLLGRRAVTLEVVGRKSGEPVRFPLVMVKHRGERYLVSMLGDGVNWIKNLRASGGRARLLNGVPEEVVVTRYYGLESAEILKEYLKHAPGARPHVAVDYRAPLADFAAVADRYPVFHVKTA